MLDRLVPPGDGSGDWDDVLARAGVTSPAAPPPAPRRRRRLLVAVAATFVIAAVAAPALALLLGWIDRRDVSFAEGRPAPNVVKKQFWDLGIRPGPPFAGGIQAGQAREVGKFQVRGKLRALWVAPTRKGGFCFLYEGLFSGCRDIRSDKVFYPKFAFGRLSPRDRAARRVLALPVLGFEGYLTTRNARRIELVYRDGARATIPFVYVSSPIEAGFFSFAVPRDRQTGRRGPVRALVLDAGGREIARQDVVPKWALKPRPVRPRPPLPSEPPEVRTLPTRLPSPPAPPLQRGSGNGASITVGANGVAIWRTAGVSGERRRILRGSVTYTCFRLVRVFGFDDLRVRWVDGAFAPQVAAGYPRLGRPLDGCDIAGGGYGHRWPDRFDSHSPVEIALTPRGRRFFADRATARDLSLFVRSRRMQQIRKLEGAAFERELRRAYPRLGRIRYTLTERGVTFTETSSTGKRFEVVVRDGRIVRENLKPYAVVY